MIIAERAVRYHIRRSAAPGGVELVPEDSAEKTVYAPTADAGLVNFLLASFLPRYVEPIILDEDQCGGVVTQERIDEELDYLAHEYLSPYQRPIVLRGLILSIRDRTAWLGPDGQHQEKF